MQVVMPCGEGIDAGKGEKVWIVSRDKIKYDEVFNSLEQQGGRITGRVAKEELVKSKLSNNVLGKIWQLADHDQVNFFTEHYFAKEMINIWLLNTPLTHHL